MAAMEMTMGIIFISQTTVGVLGNFCLLFQNLFLYMTGNSLRTDLIVMHLTVANFLTLLCKGIPQTMAALGMRLFLGDVGCKLLFYLHRVGRGVSIGSTCLLSVIQAVTISPAELRWTKHKAKAPRYIGCSLNLTWTLSILANVMFPMHIIGKLTDENITHFTDFGYCLAVRHDKMITILHALVVAIPDVLGMAFMLLASSFMVLVLCRHKQRMSDVHRTKLSSRSYAYSRATKTVLQLVSTFIVLYVFSCICSNLINFTYKPSWVLVNIAAIASGCFPCLSPFLLMRCKSTLCSDQIQNRKTETWPFSVFSQCTVVCSIINAHSTSFTGESYTESG